MCTRFTFITLGLLLVSGVSPLAHGAQREVLIWGGGKKPREAAAAVTSSFQKEEEDPSGETYVARERTRMKLLHLSEEGPRSVLEFTLLETDRNIECDKTSEAEYGPVEGKLHQGFHSFPVATVTTDQCAITYWRPEEEGAVRPTDLGITREEEIHLWDGTSY